MAQRLLAVRMVYAYSNGNSGETGLFGEVLYGSRTMGGVLFLPQLADER
jgi:hypothetical protein